MQNIPDYAYTWRPYACEEMIRKPLEGDGEAATFLIDPWTRRWLIAHAPVSRLLELADGKRRFSEIIRTIDAEHELACADEVAFEAAQLVEGGLLFNNKAEHAASGTPVYNKSEVAGLHLEITNACNMTCTHCYVASGKKLPNEMTLEEIYRTIDMLPPFSGRRIAISGGEPAVHKHCKDIVHHCAIERGHDVDLYTNGKKFPRALGISIKEMNARGLGRIRIQMSLEAATPSLNDLVRGKGSFEAAQQSLALFQELELTRNVVVFVCVTRHNIGQIEQIISLCERFDVGMLVFSQWQKQGNASDTPWEKIAPSMEQWVKAGELLLQYRNPRMLVFGNFFGDLNNNEFGRYSVESPLFPKQLYFYNSVPRVTPQGDVFADQLWVDPDWILGNVRESTLAECFETPKFQEQLQSMQQRTSKTPECKACDWRALCEGGNAGHTYSEYGHMNTPDVFCRSRKYWFTRYIQHHAAQAGLSMRTEDAQGHGLG